MMSPQPCCVAELQGVDGPVCFPELLMQKIWAAGDFSRDGLRSVAGEPIEILSVGRWNRLAGPDFVGARLSLGGRVLRGDVELHLRAEDWTAHRHAADPAFDEVILHVVLFPPSPGFQCLAHGGRVVPTLVLLPLLPRDLESYALDDAAERLANRSLYQAREVLGLLGPEQLVGELRKWAVSRWVRKVAFSRLRIERLGWEQACHAAALECLGYRFNRAPMVHVAQRWPLDAWTSGQADPMEIWREMELRWKRPWGRPHNHPNARLALYKQWVASVPDWPHRLLDFATAAGPDPVEPGDTKTERRRCKLRARREALRLQLTGGAFTGPRFDTFVCDHGWPLLAARFGTEIDPRALWFHWYPGDVPLQHAHCLRELDRNANRLHPLCTGWIQGLLGWCIDRENRAAIDPDPRRSDS